jgi:hypothetical protein
VSKNNNKAWNTKYGPRRVRNEAPTLEEAIAVAQGLSGELAAQAEIAAALMGLPHDKVRKALLKLPPAPKASSQSVVFTGPASAPRTVVVERKLRRAIPAADRMPSST